MKEVVDSDGIYCADWLGENVTCVVDRGGAVTVVSVNEDSRTLSKSSGSVCEMSMESSAVNAAGSIRDKSLTANFGSIGRSRMR